MPRAVATCQNAYVFVNVVGVNAVRCRYRSISKILGMCAGGGCSVDAVCKLTNDGSEWGEGEMAVAVAVVVVVPRASSAPAGSIFSSPLMWPSRADSESRGIV